MVVLPETQPAPAPNKPPIDPPPIDPPPIDPPGPVDPVEEITYVGPQIPPPNDAQYAWLAQNPQFMRISHALSTFTARGTLDTGGNFTPEGPGTPVLDSMDGSFGVGIPR
jgi:hypothetical protein